MKPTLLLFFWCISHLLLAQDPPPAERIVTIEITENADGSDQFVANTPPLNQMAGAKEAFWSLYWEFGDGNFSFDESPAHLYTTAGDHDVGVWATGNYDNGKPPPSKPKTRTKGGSSGGYAMVAQTVLTEAEPTIRLKSNRNPSPEEEMVCILSYANEFKESKVVIYIFILMKSDFKMIILNLKKLEHILEKLLRTTMVPLDIE